MNRTLGPDRRDVEPVGTTRDQSLSVGRVGDQSTLTFTEGLLRAALGARPWKCQDAQGQVHRPAVRLASGQTLKDGMLGAGGRGHSGRPLLLGVSREQSQQSPVPGSECRGNFAP